MAASIENSSHRGAPSRTGVHNRRDVTIEIFLGGPHAMMTSAGAGGPHRKAWQAALRATLLYGDLDEKEHFHGSAVYPRTANFPIDTRFCSTSGTYRTPINFAALEIPLAKISISTSPMPIPSLACTFHLYFALQRLIITQPFQSVAHVSPCASVHQPVITGGTA